MHIVSRRNMLALPVERLVGNSSSHGHSRRPPMSPDSSASDSSNSDSPSTTNAKVFSSYASQLLASNSSSNNGHINSTGNNNNNRRRSESPPTSPVMSSSNNNNNNNHCYISSTTSDEPVSSKRRKSCSPSPDPSSPLLLLPPPRQRVSSGSPSRSGTNSPSVNEPVQHDCKREEGDEDTNTEDKGKPLLMTASQSMTILSNKDRSKEDRVEIQFQGKVERDTSSTTTTPSIASPEGNNNSSSKNNSLPRRPSAVVGEPEPQKMTIRIIEDDGEGSSLNNSLSKMDNALDDSSDENNSICGRPPSRPPSSSSSTVTSATYPLSPNSVTESSVKGSIAMISRPQHHHHHHYHHHHNSSSSSTGNNTNNTLTSSSHGNSLKFSIDDILRPEFGKNALQRIRRASSSTPSNNNNNNSRRHSVNSNSFLEYPDSPFSSANSSSSHPQRNEPTSQRHPHHPRSLSHSPRADSIDSSNSNVKRVRTGPSSIKDHSEDSNSSCTSRKEEVVDETKVNPKVPQGPLLWPAWVYCTRYSDRPSSGPRSRRIKTKKEEGERGAPREQPEEKRPRTAFTAEQLARLKQEFDENRYLTERRRQDLARDLKLHENQIKIWFQNKRAKLKKSTGTRGGLAMQLMAQGLYNHSTVPIDEDDEMYEAMMAQQ